MEIHKDKAILKKQTGVLLSTILYDNEVIYPVEVSVSEVQKLHTITDIIQQFKAMKDYFVVSKIERQLIKEKERLDCISDSITERTLTMDKLDKLRNVKLIKKQYVDSFTGTNKQNLKSDIRTKDSIDNRVWWLEKELIRVQEECQEPIIEIIREDISLDSHIYHIFDRMVCNVKFQPKEEFQALETIIGRTSNRNVGMWLLEKYIEENTSSKLVDAILNSKQVLNSGEILPFMFKYDFKDVDKLHEIIIFAHKISDSLSIFAYIGNK